MPLHRKYDNCIRSLSEVMIQDRQQVELYEDKTAQYAAFGRWMPDTWIFTSAEEALEHKPDAWPVVSKANEGASSVNVRIINNRAEYEAHVKQAFGEGIPVNLCADGAMTTQRGYLFLQRFIPHDRTYRVNIVGERMAIFERFNYKDRPVAQTGNTNGVMRHTGLHQDLLEYAKIVGQDIGSKWVALDILRTDDGWCLLETSLAWPWNPRDYRKVPFTGGGQWGDLWDVLLDQCEAGVFGYTSR